MKSESKSYKKKNKPNSNPLDFTFFLFFFIKNPFDLTQLVLRKVMLRQGPLEKEEEEAARGERVGWGAPLSKI